MTMVTTAIFDSKRFKKSRPTFGHGLTRTILSPPMLRDLPTPAPVTPVAPRPCPAPAPTPTPQPGPAVRVVPTVEDRVWWVAEVDRLEAQEHDRREAEDRLYDLMAEEAYAMQCVEAGVMPSDLRFVDDMAYIGAVG